MLPFLEGSETAAPHEFLYWRFGKQRAIRQGDWKLVEAAGSKGSLLINLADDLGEQHDLSAKQPEKLADLEGAWKKWDSELVAPAWGGDRGATIKGNGKKKKSGE